MTTSENAPANEDKKTRSSLISFLILMVGLLALSIYMVHPYILAVAMGAILALLCWPLYILLKEGKKKRSKFASSVVTILILLSAITPIALLSFLGVQEGMNIAHSLSGNETLSFEAITEKLNAIPAISEFIGDPASLEQQIKSGIQTLAKSASTRLLAVIANLPELLLQLVLAALSCFFFLIDGPRFVDWCGSKIPLEDHIKIKLMHSFKNTIVSTILATLAASSAQATIMALSFLLLGVPGSFLAGGATFIFSWIPMIGSFPVWASGAIYLFAKGSTAKAIAMIGLGLFTSVIDNVIRPLVLKGTGEMHPLVSLVAIFGGINLFGVLGVFIGPIIAAVLISVLEVWPEALKRFDTKS